MLNARINIRAIVGTYKNEYVIGTSLSFGYGEALFLGIDTGYNQGETIIYRIMEKRTKIQLIIGGICVIIYVFIFINSNNELDKADDFVYKEYPYIDYSDSLDDIITQKFDITTLHLRTSPSHFYLKTNKGKSFCFFVTNSSYMYLNNDFTISVGDYISKPSNSCEITIEKKNGQNYYFDIRKEFHYDNSEDWTDKFNLWKILQKKFNTSNE